MNLATVTKSTKKVEIDSNSHYLILQISFRNTTTGESNNFLQVPVHKTVQFFYGKSATKFLLISMTI